MGKAYERTRTRRTLSNFIDSAEKVTDSSPLPSIETDKKDEYTDISPNSVTNEGKMSASVNNETVKSQIRNEVPEKDSKIDIISTFSEEKNEAPFSPVEDKTAKSVKSVKKLDKISTAKNKTIQKNGSFDASKYEDDEINISILLSDELNNYLVFRAMEKEISTKKFFKELMIQGLEEFAVDDSDLANKYRKVQHTTVKKTLGCNKTLREDLKVAARNNHMRFTSYIAYVIEKAYTADTEYNS